MENKNEEKIKEIIRSAHIKSECTDCKPVMVEDLMQEYGDYIRQQTLEEVIGGKIDIVKLIEHAICPHPDCDNRGTIAERVGEDEWEPTQCQWCDERKQTLENLQALKSKS
jgi:hypothetical protein